MTPLASSLRALTVLFLKLSETYKKLLPNSFSEVTIVLTAKAGKGITITFTNIDAKYLNKILSNGIKYNYEP